MALWLNSACALPKLVSINMCTDQLVLDLAEPGQILGLSPFARDPLRSKEAAKAAAFPVFSGGAEEILIRPPDIVVASPYMSTATKRLLDMRKIRIESFDLVLTLDETRAQIRKMGHLLHQNARAEARIQALDQQIEALRDALAGRNLRILPVQRRGWVSGRDSLTTDLLRQGGLGNVATEIGLQGGVSRVFKPGEHFFSDDRLPEGATFDPAVHGHWSRQLGDEPLRTLFVRA